MKSKIFKINKKLIWTDNFYLYLIKKKKIFNKYKKNLDFFKKILYKYGV
jgi:hypothetical protein